ncbi:histidine phosphatase family protein [Nocardioides sp. KIGAM211]|uniref:Histidine phosphatase family protein n=2 Tax=Nocardioides luti TaxID=2761101 RepID=A0A7X0RF48_9ACTN|nr:histidine phosphatase family protein [Nocardioides luti]MBB6625913.1 histidine phosphatase family protein [Nocardioides luti]
MRHAKAEQVGPTDHQRALTPRGLEDAAAAGRWLAAEGIVAQAALVSAATRTRETWGALSDAAGWSLEAAFDEGLYAAGPETALDLVRAVADDTGVLVLLGHNPTMAYLAQMLDDGDGDPEALAAMAASGYPTSALSVFEVDAPWADLGVATARLTAFHVGRGA